jgi:hypothetical protein
VDTGFPSENATMQESEPGGVLARQPNPASRAAIYNPSAARSSALAASNSALKSGWVEIVCAITVPEMRPISMSEG